MNGKENKKGTSINRSDGDYDMKTFVNNSEAAQLLKKKNVNYIWRDEKFY